MIEKLRKINQNLITINANKSSLEKYLLIEKILRDEKCFFKMDISYAYAILRDLEIEEKDLKMVYMELIDKKNF